MKETEKIWWEGIKPNDMPEYIRLGNKVYPIDDAISLGKMTDESLPATKGDIINKYEIIYADPPWRYGGGLGKNSKKWGNSLSAYPCMKTKDLEMLPVSQLCADNCTLFIWVTLPMLPDGLRLIKAWGFEYKTTAFVWNKIYKSGKPYCGMGYYTRSGSEICLLGVRGKPKREDKSVYQVISAIVESHSKKPSEVRERIVKLMGDKPRIELFARQRTEGWDCWGNEL